MESGPLLIYENLPGEYADAFDGFYAWINPGEKGWTADGSNWGEQYLSNFYQTMRDKYPDKIIVGGAWDPSTTAKPPGDLTAISQRAAARPLLTLSTSGARIFLPTIRFRSSWSKPGTTTKRARRLSTGIRYCGHGAQDNSLTYSARSFRRAAKQTEQGRVRLCFPALEVWRSSVMLNARLQSDNLTSSHRYAADHVLALVGCQVEPMQAAMNSHHAGL